jgi:hypothetical protein
LRARAIKSSSNKAAGVAVAAAIRRGAAFFFAATFAADRAFVFTAFVTIFLRAADFFAAGTFRDVTFEVGRARVRAGSFRLVGFLLEGIADSLAGGADR